MKRQELLEDYLYDDLTFLDPDYFDNAIIGVSNEGRVIYSFKKLIDELIKNKVCEDEMTANDFLNYETLSAYIGPEQPIIMVNEFFDYN